MDTLTHCDNGRGSCIQFDIIQVAPDPQTRPKEQPCTHQHQLSLFQLEWQQGTKVKLTVPHCVYAAKNAGIRAKLV